MDTGMLWLNVLEGLMIVITVIGAAWALSGSVGRIAASLDHLAERVDGIADSLTRYTETQAEHGERLARLEARQR